MTTALRVGRGFLVIPKVSFMVLAITLAKEAKSCIPSGVHIFVDCLIAQAHIMSAYEEPENYNLIMAKNLNHRVDEHTAETSYE